MVKNVLIINRFLLEREKAPNYFCVSYMIILPYLFEAFDPVLHMDDFELLTLLAGETRSMGDLVHRWLRKLLLVEIFFI